MTKILGFVLTLIVVAACSSSNPAQLGDAGLAVEVLANKPGPECNVVGKVIGENKQGSVELARNHARNLAGKLRANGLFINQEVPNGNNVKVYATAYQCE